MEGFDPLDELPEYAPGSDPADVMRKRVELLLSAHADAVKRLDHVTEQLAAEARIMHRDLGMSEYQIADTLKRSKPTVRKYLGKATTSFPNAGR
ncbi:hypothetical protein [Nocardia gipuzkoensis]